MFSNQENRYFFHNALSFFKRDALLKNPFNEILAGKEDRYWANNIVKKKNHFTIQQILKLSIITLIMEIHGKGLGKII